MVYQRYIIITLCTLLFSGCQSTLYSRVGIGIMAQNGAPEVMLQDPLASFAVGIRNRDGYYMEFDHTSSIPQEEKGLGLSKWEIGKEFEF